MTIPRYLASSFYFEQQLAIADVANIITHLETILPAQTPAWTNPSAGVLVSPVDSAGRFMTLTFVATAANRLLMTVQDQNGTTICSREMDLAAFPTTINYFSGQYYLYLESLTQGSGSGEWIGAFMVDPTDYDLGDNGNYVIGGGYRNSGGAPDGSGSIWDQFFMLESGVTQLRQRSRAVSTSPGVNANLLDFAGNVQLFPFDVYGIPGGLGRWMGSAYQAQQIDPSVPAGVVKPIAIDGATPAEFRTTVVPANAQGTRLALRVS